MFKPIWKALRELTISEGRTLQREVGERLTAQDEEIQESKRQSVAYHTAFEEVKEWQRKQRNGDSNNPGMFG